MPIQPQWRRRQSDRMSTIRTLQPEQLRFLRWLGPALLLHAALLLLPVSPYGRGADVARALSVSLIAPGPAPEERRPAPPAPAPSPQPAAPPEPSVSPPPRTETAEPPVSSLRPEAVAKPAAPDLSAAQLLELSRQREWSLPKARESRPLGVFTPRPEPENWRSPGALGPSRFDGRSLPDDVEVVDRWVAQDGSHNVLVETPGGDLLCGRAVAWDPMRPLVENVMMFQSCGAGTRTFEWPEHYRVTREPPGR